MKNTITATGPAYIAAVFALLMWGGTSVANKIAVGYLDGMSVGIIRSIIAGVCAFIIVLSYRFPFPKTKKERTILLVSGISSFAVWPVVLSIGISKTTAGHAALIMATIPIATILISSLVEQRLPRMMWWLGSLIAFVGTILLIMERGFSLELFDQGSSVIGDIVVLIGGIICALGYVAGGYLSKTIGSLHTTFWGLSLALFVLVPVFLFRFGNLTLNHVPEEAWLAIVWMSLFSSIAGYLLWFFALGQGGVKRIGSMQMAQPVITLITAALLLNEMITKYIVLVTAIILLGTYVAQRNATEKNVK